MTEEYERNRARSEAEESKQSDTNGKRRRQAGGRQQGNGAREPIRGYRELRVYQGAMEAAMGIFELTKQFPAEEGPSMVVQMRRSSRSVCAGIGQAWRRRRSQAQFVGKLCDSESEAEQTRVWIEFAARCRYLSDGDAQDLGERYDKILAQLVKMISDVDRWTIRSPDA